MKQQDLQRLKAMGLTYWQVRKADFFPEYTSPQIDLPAECQLLFVCDETLDEHDRYLFGRILKSMKLTPEQALMLPVNAMEQLGEHHLTWVWFAGCDAAVPTPCQVLRSPSLKLMHSDSASKKALWQQICSYDN